MKTKRGPGISEGCRNTCLYSSYDLLLNALKPRFDTSIYQTDALKLMDIREKNVDFLCRLLQSL